MLPQNTFLHNLTLLFTKLRILCRQILRQLPFATRRAFLVLNNSADEDFFRKEQGQTYI